MIRFLVFVVVSSFITNVGQIYKPEIEIIVFKWNLLATYCWLNKQIQQRIIIASGGFIIFIWKKMSKILPHNLVKINESLKKA